MHIVSPSRVRYQISKVYNLEHLWKLWRLRDTTIARTTFLSPSAMSTIPRAAVLVPNEGRTTAKRDEDDRRVTWFML